VIPPSDDPINPGSNDSQTDSSPPAKRLPALRARPTTGLLAWQATVGYLSQNKYPDAQLAIQVIPQDRGLSWSAALSWGHHRESVIRRATLAAALDDLWLVVRQNVVIFEQKADEVLSPAHYDQAEWLDIPTQEILQRLLWMTMTAFRDRWLLLMIYQPVENTQQRIQMRLLVRSAEPESETGPAHYEIVVGARGASLIDACRTLYRHAAPHFLVHTAQTQEIRGIQDEQGDNQAYSDTD
jgi:hypothetical protein